LTQGIILLIAIAVIRCMACRTSVRTVDIVGTNTVGRSVAGRTRARAYMRTTERASRCTILSRAIGTWLFAVAFDLSLLAKVAGRSNALKSTPFPWTRR
jgi:hypothetical protein